ncbi:MAG: hypothetical protein JWO56_1924 [Acidobacteria bacterium]|nr:hypothetical protein [Acidobacteriota bacterium]
MTLEADMPPEYQHLERIVVGRALVYRGAVSLNPLPNMRRIAIVFNDRPSRTRPTVMADGPRTKRHRFTAYRPLPLCLWFADDSPEKQWRLENGLVGLVDITRLHLLREARFRQTGRWLGPEVHLDDSDVPTNRAFRRMVDRDGPRVKCWCGSGRRYIRCHGGVAEQRELVALGLLKGSEDRLAVAA